MKKKKQKQVEYEPKMENRFTVEFIGIDIPKTIVKTITRPTYISNNNTFKGSWGNIEISLIDLVELSTSKVLYDVIKQKKRFSNQPIFEIIVEMLDPTGVVVEKWGISVKKIIYVNFGNCDWSSDSISEIKLIVEPKSCKIY